MDPFNTIRCAPLTAPESEPVFTTGASKASLSGQLQKPLLFTADQLARREDFGELLNERKLLGEAVEVGVYRGVFSKALLDRWRGRMLHLVDSWRHLSNYFDGCNLSDRDHATCLAETQRNLARHRGRFRIHRKLSLEAVSSFRENSLDFVYIDANHAYEAVFQDIRAWYPRLKADGILAGHDFMDGDLPGGQFGVETAVREFQQQLGIELHLTDDPPYRSWYLLKP